MSKSRNDGILYTGAASRSSDRRQEQSAEKQKMSRVLEPSYELVNGLVQKHYDKTGELLLNIVDEDSPDDNVQAKLMAVRLHRKFIIDFQTELRNILRPPKKKKEPTDETWE